MNEAKLKRKIELALKSSIKAKEEIDKVLAILANELDLKSITHTNINESIEFIKSALKEFGEVGNDKDLDSELNTWYNVSGHEDGV